MTTTHTPTLATLRAALTPTSPNHEPPTPTGSANAASPAGWAGSANAAGSAGAADPADSADAASPGGPAGPAGSAIPAGAGAGGRVVVAAGLPGGRELGELVGWEQEAALAVATSGSTGSAKVVLLSAAALVASAEATHARLGGAGTWLLALPTTHIAGIQVLVRSIVAGTEPGVMDLAAGFRASGFAAAARPVLATPGPHYTALVPTQLARLVATEGPGLAAIRAFDAVLIGGAATPPSLLRRAREAGVNVVTTYGMSETAGGCVYDGHPLDGVRVRLDSHGRVEVAGPTLALGYQGGEPFGEWFRTGDLGRITAGGTLEITGRADDVIISGGENVSPQEVERVLAAQSGVHEVCVVGVPDAEWGQAVVAAVVPADPDDRPDPDVLRQAVHDAVGRFAMPKRVVFLGELPTRGPGKVDRAAVARSFG